MIGVLNAPVGTNIVHTDYTQVLLLFSEINKVINDSLPKGHEQLAGGSHSFTQ
jgi:hypothetical protein